MKEVVLIVGASSGMGLGAARAALAAGYAVIVSSRSLSRAQATVEELKVLCPDGLAQAVELDFLDQRSVSRAMDGVGPLDHVVLCGSGAPARGGIVDLTEERLKQAFDEKFLGYFRCLQAGLKVLSEHGSVVVVTGGAARAAIPGTSAVAAINAALQAWALVLAKELSPRRVNVFSPGFIDTPLHDWMSAQQKSEAFRRLSEMVPLRRLGTVEEVGQAIVFLLRNSYVNGAVLDLDGGLRLR